MAETKKSIKSGTASKSGLDSIDKKNTVEVKSTVKTAKKKDNAEKKVKETKKTAKKAAKKSTAKSEKKTAAKTAAETNQKKSVQNDISSNVQRTAEKGNAAAETEKQPEPVKKVETKKETAPVKAAPKAEEPKKEAAPVKAAPKAEEPKKETAPVKAAPKAEEPKKETAPVKAAPKAEEPKKEAAPVKAAPKAEEPKKEAAPVKAAAKAEEAAPVVVEETVVEAVPAKEEVDIAEKLKHYNSFDLDTEIAMLNAMGIQKSKEDIAAMLIASDDEVQIALDLLDEAGIKAGDFDFEDDGYDYTLVPVVIDRIGATMDFKASDFRDITNEVKKAIQFQMTDDAMENAESYKNMLDLVRKVLVLAQEKNITSLDELEKYIPADIKALVVKFMDTAYDILKNWQYNDVKFYEGFIYAVLSQFDELHKELGNRAMMDVADLYIIHGDFGKGDADYNYVLRENKLKDYIYYRFANIYNDIDRNKAKAIAGGSLRYVDGRYTYYPNIMQILES